MKKYNFLFLGIFLIFLIGLVSSASISINVRPLDGSNLPTPLTGYTYNFTWINNSNCSASNNIVFSNLSISITTTIAGDANITLQVPSNPTSIPTNLCEYRNNTLRISHELSSSFLNTIFAQSLNTTGNVTANAGYFTWLADSVTRITKGWFTNLDVKNNINSSNVTTFNVIVNGTNIDTTYLNTNDFNITNTTYLRNNGDTATGSYTFDTNTFFIDSTNDRVGIGTTNPGYNLDVNGTGRFKSSDSNSVFFGNSNEGADNSTWKIRRDGMETGSIDIQLLNDAETLGSYAMHIGRNAQTVTKIVFPTGNVGIGTTNPNKILHILGTSSETIRIESSSATGAGISINGLASNMGREWTIYSLANGSSQGAGKFLIRDNNVSQDRFIIDTSGNVGIGTTSPRALLDVNGSTSYINLYSTFGGGILFNDTRAVNRSWAIQPTETQYQSGGTDGLFNIIDVANNKAVMTFQRGGNVGIGTTIPDTTLSVNSSTPTTNISINGINAPGFRGLKYQVAGSDFAWDRADSSTGEFRREVGSVAFGGHQTFYTDTLERIRITSTGNIGINTTNPQNTLNVMGDGNFTGLLYANGNNVMTTNQWNATNTSYYLANNPSTFWNTTFATFNKTYADTLYFGIGNWNATNTSYYLANNPSTFWNTTFATFNKTYADTLYFGIGNWNSTNTTYRTNYNTTWVGDLNVTGISYQTNLNVSGFINQTVSGKTRYFSNGCSEIANSTGLFWIC